MKWGAQLRKTRRAYGVEQEWFALQLGMTTKQLRALETGKTELPYQKRFEIMSAIERFNPENEPLSIMFDYMRIRFKTSALTASFLGSIPFVSAFGVSSDTVLV